MVALQELLYFITDKLMHNNSVRVEYDEVSQLLAPSVGFELYKAVDMPSWRQVAQADAQIINDSLFLL